MTKTAGTVTRLPGQRSAAPMWLVLTIVVAVPAAASIWDGVTGSETAPDFALTSTGYEDGIQSDPVNFTLQDYRGKTVLLDFMGVLCAACRILTDDVLKPLHEAYNASDDVVIVSIDVWAGQAGETQEELVHLQEHEALAWRHALDTDDVRRKYTTISIPKITIIDPDGVIVYERMGLPSYDEVDSAVQGSIAGTADAARVVRLGLIGLAFVAGAASFFSPCSVALIPAYLGYLLQRQDTAHPRQAVRLALGGSLRTAAGIVTVYAGLAVVLSLAGDTLRPFIPILSPIVAALLVILGSLMLIGFGWGWLSKGLGVGEVDGRRGFYAFGLGYGFAAFSCTGPVLLPILLGAFVDGLATGLLSFAAYTTAVAGFVILAGYLVASGQSTRLRGLLAKTTLITRISAIMMIGAGLYLLWFDYRAYGLPFA